MEYILMHKNTAVADITIDSATAVISSVGEVYNIEHSPVGIHLKNGKIDRASLNKWWTGRAIPTSRIGIKEALDSLGIDSAVKLLDKAYGLSLSDHYWIKPHTSNLSWEDINFFDNDFSEDLGNILFGEHRDCKIISLMSPDNTSDGWLKKKWKIIHGNRCLIKSGSGATQQEPYNEVIASIICDRLGIEHVPYQLIMQNEYPYSVCQNFITQNTELISAWYILQSLKKPNNISTYQHYLNCADNLNIPNVVDSLNKMIVLDFIIGNEDRHLGNFGVIRNVETLQYIGPAPIYDSGTSLWYNKPVAMINKDEEIPCKPFKKSHLEQIKLVTSFDFFTPEALHGIEDEIRELTKGSVFLTEDRINKLCQGLADRIKKLNDLIAK